MENREQRIRAIAYSMWEEEGRPEGKEEEHWRAAIEIVDMEDAERAGFATPEKEKEPEPNENPLKRRRA